MRKWASVAVLAALVGARTPRSPSTPPKVYSDYAADGVLSCGHSRAALKGVLNDASIHQYGDPLTFVGLKLAVRKQLAGGCRREERAVLPDGPVRGAAGGSAGGSRPARRARRSLRGREEAGDRKTLELRHGEAAARRTAVEVQERRRTDGWSFSASFCCF